MTASRTARCPNCGHTFRVLEDEEPDYCPYCGYTEEDEEDEDE